MTQAAYSFTRKRPADGPLPTASPSKHPRVTPYDKSKNAVSYVTSVFAPASTGLPLHNKPISTVYSTQHSSPRVSTTPRRTPMASQAVNAPPQSNGREAMFPGPPRFQKKVDEDGSLPPSTPPSIPSTSQTSSDSRNSSSRSHARRNSTPSTRDYPSDNATASSSSPIRTTRPSSIHGSTALHASRLAAAEAPKPSILDSRSWKSVSYPPESTSSASSVASTSRVTLDSASSWRSTDSNVDRPSSATSATSTGSCVETPQPSKEPFVAPSGALFSTTASTLPTSLSSSPRVPSASSTQLPPSEPSRAFNYAPKSDIHGPEWMYKSEFTRDKSAKRSRSRPHIFQDQHNRDVKARLQKLFTSMRKYTPDWFAKLKNRGYEGSEEEFTAFADYTVRAMVAVNGVTKDDDEMRMGVDRHFAKIQPALFKSVKRVLEGPKPKTIFTPGFDLLNKVIRAKDAAIDDLLRPPKPSLPSELPAPDEEYVKKTLRMSGFVSKVAREQVGDADIRRLKPREWLNDEVINFYGALINARVESGKAQVARGKVLNAFYFSSFFWTKLSVDGYEKAKLDRWTKKAKVDIFTKDIVILPINHNQTHWTAGAINFQKKRFESYDSMGIAKEKVPPLLRRYVAKEHEKKKGKPFDFEGWVDYCPDDIPQQDNGYDCGVFTCQFMESLSRGEDDFVFTQEDMAYLRRRMIYEIGHAKLRTD